MLDLEIIGQGATTTIYRDGNKAVKLYANAPPNAAEHEAARQQFAISSGLTVPAVIGVRQVNDNAVALDMEYVNGKPLMQPKMSKDERRDAIDVLVKLQCEVHKVTAIGQPEQVSKLVHNIKHTQYILASEKVKLLAALKRLDTNANNLCHGDFHPLNILYDGSKYWIIDWVDATAGSPLADACRTYLIFKQFITCQAEIYLQTFCKEANVKMNDILAWMPIIAAARLNENMEGSLRTWLLDIINTEHL